MNDGQRTLLKNKLVALNDRLFDDSNGNRATAFEMILDQVDEETAAPTYADREQNTLRAVIIGNAHLFEIAIGWEQKGMGDDDRPMSLRRTPLDRIDRVESHVSSRDLSFTLDCYCDERTVLSRCADVPEAREELIAFAKAMGPAGV